MNDCDVCTYEIAHDNAGVCCGCTAILHADQLNLQFECERLREARDVAERATVLYADDRNEWSAEAERLRGLLNEAVALARNYVGHSLLISRHDADGRLAAIEKVIGAVGTERTR